MRPSDGAARRSEQLLTVDEAARRLSTSPDDLYRHSKKLPFAHKYPWVRFGASGIDKFIQRGGMASGNC